jgi:hypothetical protein
MVVIWHRLENRLCALARHEDSTGLRVASKIRGGPHRRALGWNYVETTIGIINDMDTAHAAGPAFGSA